MSMSETSRPRAAAAAQTRAFGLRIDVVDSFDQIAVMMLIGCLIAVAMTFRDYGIIWDEEWQNIYGQKLLSYYASGFADQSAFHYSNLYLYGGLFDLTAALVNLVSPLGPYETRHLMGGLVGALALSGAWAMGRRLGGPRSGALSVALLGLTPVFYGHIYFNPKDIPFACGMVWSLYWLVRIAEELPRPRWSSVVVFGIVAGMTLATRIGALILFIYLGAAIAAFAAGLRLVRRRDWRHALGMGARAALRVLPAFPIAYAVMAIGWPWAVQSFANPLHALWTFSHFGWEGLVEIDGQWVSALRLPSDYLPLFLAIQLPEVLLIGLVAFVVSLAWYFRTLAMARLRVGIGLGLVVLAALFPIVYFIIFRPNAYHTVRHFLFVIPPLAVLAALGLDRLWRLAERRRLGSVMAILLCIAGGIQIERMAALHPDEYVSYNALVGGVAGAKNRFELDYWGNSLAEASRLLVAKVHSEGPMRAKGPYYVKVGAYPLSAGYFLPPSFRLTEDPDKADFIVSLTEGGCDKTMSGKIIARVVRDSATLAVVKDRRMLTRPPMITATGP